MKKFLFVFLTILLLVISLSVLVSADSYDSYDSVSGLNYHVYNDEVSIIENWNRSVNVVIPETIDGYPVVYTSMETFKWSTFSSATLPSTLKVIGSYTFYQCEKLESIIIPDNVTSIGEKAFFMCTSLNNVTISNDSKLENIGSYAFKDCPISSIYIPEGVTSIGNSAFLGCTSLKSVIIPESVTSIGNSAFGGCTNLTLRGVKDSYAETYANANSIPFVEIKAEIVSGVIKNTDITWVIDENGVLTISGIGDIPDYSASVRAPWYENRAGITSVIVDNGITRIGDQTFAFLENATSITLPDSVKSVGTLFMRNTAVEEIDLSSVETVGEGAFNAAANLKTIIFSEKLRDCQGNIFAATQTVTVKAPTKSYAYYYGKYFSTLYPAKATVTAVSNGTAQSPILAFGKMGDNAIYAIYEETDRNVMEVSGKGTTYNYWFISEKRIEMDKAEGGNNFAPIYYLYEDALTQPIVRAIKKLVVREGISSIGNYSFYRCLKATEVEILGEITWIGNAAFQACEGIRSITLPESCTRLGNNVFNGCRYLGSVTIPGDMTQIGEEIFKGCLVDRIEVARPESANLLVYTNSEFLKDYVNEVYPNENFRVVVRAK